MKKGFTLLELIIVIIILGSIRTAQQAYYLERGFYAASPYFIILTFADGAWTGSQGYY